MTLSERASPKVPKSGEARRGAQYDLVSGRDTGHPVADESPRPMGLPSCTNGGALGFGKHAPG